MSAGKKIRKFVWFTLLIAVFSASGLRAQITDVTDLRQQIERNEELLSEAERLVRSTNSAKARTSLETAIALHKLSLNQVADRPRLAALTATKAREAILRTIAIAKREAKLEDNAQREIERAGGRLERAKNLLDERSGPGDQPAQKLVEESSQQLRRAGDSMREHMFEVALRLAGASIDLSNRAIQMLKRDAVLPEKVTRELARTDRLLDRADESEDGSAGQQVSRELRDAHDLQDRARRSAVEGKHRFALEQTQRARSLVRRVLKNTSESPEAKEKDVGGAVSLTDRLLEQAFEVARELREERAIDGLREAERLQARAKRELEGEQYGSALASTHRAREVIKIVMRDVEKPVNPGQVRTALERTDESLAQARAAIQGKGDASAEALLQRAFSRQVSAWDAFESGEPKKALANTKIARNLAKKALRRFDDGQH